MHKKKPDPIISEVWANRDDYAARLHYDVQAIFRDIRGRQRQSKRQYVAYSARRTAHKGDESYAPGQLTSGK